MSNEQTSFSNPQAVQLPLKRRSLEEALAEVDREIKVRMRCYDRWVSEGKLSRIDAVDRVERLQAALSYLNELDHGSASA